MSRKRTVLELQYDLTIWRGCRDEAQQELDGINARIREIEAQVTVMLGDEADPSNADLPILPE